MMFAFVLFVLTGVVLLLFVLDRFVIDGVVLVVEAKPAERFRFSLSNVYRSSLNKSIVKNNLTFLTSLNEKRLTSLR
jgi:hypothetical protein